MVLCKFIFAIHIRDVKGKSKMKYISPKEAAQKWGISQHRVHTLCGEGRIQGAVRHSRVWLIPETAKKPKEITPL